MISKAEHGTYLEFVYLNVGINSVNRVNRLLGDSLVKYKSFIEWSVVFRGRNCGTERVFKTFFDFKVKTNTEGLLFKKSWPTLYSGRLARKLASWESAVDNRLDNLQVTGI